MMHDLKVVNVKVSVKITSAKYQEVISQISHLQCNQKPNFTVLFHTYTYTIFKASIPTGYLHCNITKLSTFSNVSKAVKLLSSLLPKASFINLSIDNITSTSECDRKQNLDNLFVKLQHTYILKYNLQKFPAIFIRVPFDKGDVTVFVFASGKLVCVGAKSPLHLEQVSKWIRTEINDI